MQSKVRRINLTWILLYQLKWIMDKLFRILCGPYQLTQFYLRAGFSLPIQASFFLICMGDCTSAGYDPSVMPRPTVQMAEFMIIKSSQRSYFSNKLVILEEKWILNKKSSIYKLDPYLDNCGLLRVCGQIQKSVVSEEMKHPVLIARYSEIAIVI